MSVTLSMLVANGSAFAQQATLQGDAEYEVAYLRGSPSDINFYPSGRVLNGVLKVDYIRDGFTYVADTRQWFFEDGRVFKGVLKGAFKVGDILFEAGAIEYYPSGRVKNGVIKESTTIDGVLIPLKSDVSFRDDGRLVNVSPQAQNNMVYRVLHRTVRGNNFSVAWNKDTGQYEFLNYVTGVKQLVARIPPTGRGAAFPNP